MARVGGAETTNLNSRTYSYTPGTGPMRRVTWLWEEAGYKPQVNYPSNLGSVTMSAAWADGYYQAGSTVTLTATPEPGVEFGGWYYEGGYSALSQIELTVDKAIAAEPYFKGPWVVSGSDMSDGYWTFTISGETTDRKLTKKSHPAVMGVCDFRKPISDNSIITEFAQSIFYSGSDFNFVREIYLPTTLAKIGDNAFRDLSNATTITPLLPESVTYIGPYAFCGCAKVAGPLVVGMNKNRPVTCGVHTFEGMDSVRSITLGPGITELPGNMINQTANLDEVILLGEVTSIGSAFLRLPAGSTYNQTKVLKFSSFPTSYGTAPFQNWYAKCTCVYVPKGNANWGAWMADSSKMTPWNKDVHLQDFTNHFPGASSYPKGLSVENNNTASGLIFRNQWIFTWDPHSASTLLLVK